MSVGETFGDLGLGLKRLQDVVDALHMTIAEDRPAGGDSMVVDAIESETLDLLGLIQEARDGVSDAEKGLRSAPDLDATRRALVLCQKRVQTIERRYADMVSFDGVQRLLGLGGRGREWAAWANATKRAIEDCRSPMREVSEALGVCWQELTELLAWLVRTPKSGIGPS
jgi:hypothetical protein